MQQSHQKKKLKTWFVRHYDKISYSDGLRIQTEFQKKVKEEGDQFLLFLEHTPVITLGRRTDKKDLLLSPEELTMKGVELFQVDRGGSATYHGPGQLVGYVICKVSRFGGIHALVISILKAIQKTITGMGISCKLDIKNPGIWTETDPPRKLAAVGMQVKDGISMHGFAINVDMPLTGFSMIVPCGLRLPVSTLSIEKGENINLEQFKMQIKTELLEFLI
ncbi:MAG: lipoyl(octanoyl) transferase LipB [Candidatus Kariarchaeaceae archaeon]|jgi:lipoate-protein ligase B